MTRVVTRVGAAGSEVEAEGAQLLAAVVGDLVGTPRRHPHPVDAVRRDETLERLRGLVLDDVGEGARSGRQRHVDDGVRLRVDGDAVDEAEVDDVDAELGVDDVAHGFLDVGHVGRGGGLGHDETPWGEVELVEVMSTPARARASVNAVQPSRAHLTRAGYFETPANATPSPMTDSSPATWPREVSMARIASKVTRASATRWPMTSSARTDALATEIEQPCAS